MNPHELYSLWTPARGSWSAWVKPVLFAHLTASARDSEADRVLEDIRSLRLEWAPKPGERIGIVLDLPGMESLTMGLALSLRGYQPVPLFNTSPGPGALVPQDDIVKFLRGSAAVMREASIDGASPPAFLLDCRRMRGVPRPRIFDNRWMTFPQDFPSAAALLRSGVRQMLLVLEATTKPADDLAHILYRWQEQGIGMLTIDPYARGAQPEPIMIARPRGLRSIWRRALVTLGLRRNSAGGFGGIVPEASARTGFG